MSSLLGRTEALTFFISMLPISELRGALPFALSQGLSPLKAYLVSVAGNILPVLPLLLLLRGLSAFLVRYRIGAAFFNWTMERAKKRRSGETIWIRGTYFTGSYSSSYYWCLDGNSGKFSFVDAD